MRQGDRMSPASGDYRSRHSTNLQNVEPNANVWRLLSEPTPKHKLLVRVQPTLQRVINQGSDWGKGERRTEHGHEPVQTHTHTHTHTRARARTHTHTAR